MFINVFSTRLFARGGRYWRKAATKAPFETRAPQSNPFLNPKRLHEQRIQIRIHLYFFGNTSSLSSNPNPNPNPNPLVLFHDHEQHEFESILLSLTKFSNLVEFLGVQEHISTQNGLFSLVLSSNTGIQSGETASRLASCQQWLILHFKLNVLLEPQKYDFHVRRQFES